MKIGIDLGGSHIGIGVVDENGKIIEKKETDLKLTKESDITKFIEDYILKTIKKMQENYKIEKIGVASPRKPKRWKN